MIPFAIGFTMVIIALIMLWIKKSAPESEMMRDFNEQEFRRFFIGFFTIGTLLVLWGVITFFTAKPPYLMVTYNKEDYFIDGKIEKIGYMQQELFKSEKDYQLYVVSWKDLNERDLRFELISPSKQEKIYSIKVTKLHDQREKNLISSIKASEMYVLSPIRFNQTGKWKVHIYEGNDLYDKWDIRVRSQKEIVKMNEDYEKHKKVDSRFDKFMEFVN